MLKACKGTRGGTLMPDARHKTPFQLVEAHTLFFMRRIAQFDKVSCKLVHDLLVAIGHYALTCHGLEDRGLCSMSESR